MRKTSASKEIPGTPITTFRFNVTGRRMYECITKEQTTKIISYTHIFGCVKSEQK